MIDYGFGVVNVITVQFIKMIIFENNFIQKSVELKKLWMEEEKERLDVLLRGWKDCLTAENQLLKHTHQSHGDRALKIAGNIYNEDVCSELAIMRTSPHKYRDFEVFEINIIT